MLLSRGGTLHTRPALHQRNNSRPRVQRMAAQEGYADTFVPGTVRAWQLARNATMQEFPLVTSSMLRHAARHHGGQTVVSMTVEGARHVETYAQLYARCVRLAMALGRLGCRHGDTLATCAWNTHRHLECWHSLQGQGLVCHTLNPRLFPEQLVYIANEAQDKYVLIDVDLVPLFETLAPRVPSLLGVIVLTDREHMPKSSALRLLCYEELLAAETLPADVYSFEWSCREEHAPAGLCFTSGTTGNPKGVLYSHRSQIVPTFHANAWGICGAALIAGTRLVLPGPRLDGASVHALINAERVTLSAAVPTVWMGLLAHLQSTKGATIGTMDRVVIGGAAVPASMLRAFEQDFGVRVLHAYGLTETSPLLTLNTPKGGVARTEEQKMKQGRAIYTVDLRIVGDDGRELPWDGVATGDLQARGPGVLRSYYKHANPILVDGWFDTGDVASIDEHGFICISDRKKDVVKSGGEWISSLGVETAAMGMPSLAAAACIGVPDDKWGERPLLVAVPRPGEPPPTEAEVLTFLRPLIARYWLPDRVVFVEALPIGATGKVDKKELRKRFPTAPRPRL